MVVFILQISRLPLFFSFSPPPSSFQPILRRSNATRRNRDASDAFATAFYASLKLEDRDGRQNGGKEGSGEEGEEAKALLDCTSVAACLPVSKSISSSWAAVDVSFSYLSPCRLYLAADDAVQDGKDVLATQSKALLLSSSQAPPPPTSNSASYEPALPPSLLPSFPSSFLPNPASVGPLLQLSSAATTPPLSSISSAPSVSPPYYPNPLGKREEHPVNEVRGDAFRGLACPVAAPLSHSAFFAPGNGFLWFFSGLALSRGVVTSAFPPVFVLGP